MSIIASIGGSDSGLYEWLQQIAGQQEGTEAMALPSREPPTEAERAEHLQGLAERIAEEAGLDADAAADLQDQITSAVSAALEEADESADHREVVREAIDAVLEENGLDPEEFQPPAGGMPPMGGMSGQDGTTAQTSATDLLSLLGYSENTNTTLSEFLMGLLPIVDEVA